MSDTEDNIIALYDEETRFLLAYCDQELAALNGEGCLLMDGTAPLCTEHVNSS